MSKNNSVRRAVRGALLTSAAAALVGVVPAQAQEDAAIQEVVVTGSRIPQPNLTSVSPVTAVSSDQVKIEGVTRVEDLINNLPQAFADLGGNLSNGSTGTATVNLRNLGPQRTLVRRLRRSRGLGARALRSLAQETGQSQQSASSRMPTTVV